MGLPGPTEKRVARLPQERESAFALQTSRTQFIQFPPASPMIDSPQTGPMRAAAEWQIWFDGSAFPNPGRIGIGAVLRGPDGQQVDFSGQAGGGCNNEAELLALGKALELASESGARHLTVRGDSDFAVRHARGDAQTEVPHLRRLIEVTRRLLDAFDSVRLEWVPRHRNLDADRLSRAALGLPDKPALSPSSRRRR
jgi:ribonuclease HI